MICSVFDISLLFTLRNEYSLVQLIDWRSQIARPKTNWTRAKNTLRAKLIVVTTSNHSDSSRFELAGILFSGAPEAVGDS